LPSHAAGHPLRPSAFVGNGRAAPALVGTVHGGPPQAKAAHLRTARRTGLRSRHGPAGGRRDSQPALSGIHHRFVRIAVAVPERAPMSTSCLATRGPCSRRSLATTGVVADLLLRSVAP